MQVRTEEGNKDVSILNVTESNFICPEGEERYYHCRIEVKKFNAETGERLSRPRIQVFGKKYFENGGREELARQGYTIDVLHNPAKWIAEHAEEEAKAAAERAALKAKQEEERKIAEREALKASILAELKADGYTISKAPEKPAKGK